ncbi:DUF4652 domain-containing protein [Acetoanaerobium noterae]|uniref:DUF4652 domain-containing protein n=1 Tax=Acetoanaerobium noterae TaxID=745369 RepID=UPI0032423782
MISILSSLNVFNETMFITFLSFVFAILLGIDSSCKDDIKFYMKKYIIMVYSLLTLFLFFLYKDSIFEKLNNILTASLIIFIFIFIILISSINVAFNFGEEEKKIKLFQIMVYSFFSWFFLSQSYIIIVTLVLEICIYIWLNNPFIALISVAFLFLFHIILVMKDTFGYYDFNHIYTELKYSSDFLNDYRKHKSRIIKYGGSIRTNFNHKFLYPPDFPLLLWIIIQIEDKDFFNRNKTTFSIKSILKRKLFKNSINWEKNYEKYVYERKSVKLIDSIKKIFKRKNIKKILNLINKNNILRVFNKKNIRGFSTIEQQFFRRAALKTFTYHYRYRRKIFIEYIYNKYFIEFYLRRKNSLENVSFRLPNYIKSSKRDNEDKAIERRKMIYEIKLEILIYYYFIILKSPRNKELLLNSISKECGQKVNVLEKKIRNLNQENIDFIEKLLKGDKIMRVEFIPENDFEEEIKYGKLLIENNNEVILEVDSCFPKILGDKILYISPYEFESLSNIHIFNLEDLSNTLVLEHEYNLNPKYVDWRDENNLVIILGETYGTTTIGGDLYSYNLNNQKLELMKKFDSKIQITSFDILKEYIKCKGIIYKDDEYLDYENYETIIYYPANLNDY